jgi:K(+)-stimulated pyrophosphate-energized sodium pump
MESTVLPILVLAAGIVLSYEAAGLYGVAIAAAGMMATTAMQLAIDAFGPLPDNAGGIAEMSELPKEVRERTDILDAVGNTTRPPAKGFAIASAAPYLAGAVCRFSWARLTSTVIDISKANVLAAFCGRHDSVHLLGVGHCGRGPRGHGHGAGSAAAVPRDSGHSWKARAGRSTKVRGHFDAGGIPRNDFCRAPLRCYAVIIGFLFGPRVLGGLLAGVTVSGVLMAMFQSNAGGAWDNAKKSFEKGVMVNGKMEYKGSDAHKASVTGDTVGDPFKDTSGPSMNILIKLMSIVSLVIAPHIAEKDGERGMAPVQLEKERIETAARPHLRYAQTLAPAAAQVIYTALREVK